MTKKELMMSVLERMGYPPKIDDDGDIMFCYQLKTIYVQRRNHRLPEWRAFCDWIRTLPNSEFIVREDEA